MTLTVFEGVESKGVRAMEHARTERHNSEENSYYYVVILLLLLCMYAGGATAAELYPSSYVLKPD